MFCVQFFVVVSFSIFITFDCVVLIERSAKSSNCVCTGTHSLAKTAGLSAVGFFSSFHCSVDGWEFHLNTTGNEKSRKYFLFLRTKRRRRTSRYDNNTLTEWMFWMNFGFCVCDWREPTDVACTNEQNPNGSNNSNQQQTERTTNVNEEKQREKTYERNRHNILVYGESVVGGTE